MGKHHSVWRVFWNGSVLNLCFGCCCWKTSLTSPSPQHIIMPVSRSVPAFLKLYVGSCTALAYWLGWRTRTSVNFILRVIWCVIWFGKRTNNNKNKTISISAREKLEKHNERIRMVPQPAYSYLNLCCPLNHSLKSDILFLVIQVAYLRELILGCGDLFSRDFYFIHCLYKDLRLLVT